eukprot:CAMPEP_0172545970 /NCGR_PEP_ID=MMETSP1067-20121228/15802_1 /TAXON_ID=265564 ORGANISM="Thalassiosira punctigera, Strain Tpunct2005C2" /NCGR_SAMPLE_ID=MMETSP1067 /ASSEMBLY_ACC=CAM_ASM_000444 /LENGTH=372 /DNA_ID=CAMNT_0013332817 /DNA_START=98 /DNA_END=1216 /DNA_ORIENTATION=-
MICHHAPALLLALSFAAIGGNVASGFVATCGGLVHAPLPPLIGHGRLSASASTSRDADGNGNDETTPPFAIVDAGRRKFLYTVAPAASLSYALPLLSNVDGASALDCDPRDVLCRQKQYDSYVDSFQEVKDLPPGRPIPKVTNRITYVVQLIVDIGERRDGDAGILHFGLYGDDCPGSVRQMLLFLTRGISSLDRAALDDRLEVDAMPVSLADGNGSVQNVCPGNGVDFGVPSQSKAYARNKGARNAGPNFVPQGRPLPTLEDEAYPRPHAVAGLVSMPAMGMGYGANESDLDEIFARAFTITAGATPALDDAKNVAQRHRVIGQIIDDESMQFLDRLANLPVQKKLGVGSSGPPLPKVRVRDIDVQKVKTR